MPDECDKYLSDPLRKDFEIFEDWLKEGQKIFEISKSVDPLFNGLVNSFIKSTTHLLRHQKLLFAIQAIDSEKTVVLERNFNSMMRQLEKQGLVIKDLEKHKQNLDWIDRYLEAEAKKFE